MFTLMLLLLAGAAPCAPVPPLRLSFPSSSTALFAETARAYYEEAKECDRPVRMIRPQRLERLISAILEASEQVWPWDLDRPRYMFCVMLTETSLAGEDPRSGIRERTYGRWCLTVAEARIACAILGEPCPYRDRDVIDRIEGEVRTDAIWAAVTLREYERLCRGDKVRGLLYYKYGGAGLLRAIERAPKGSALTDLWPWQRFDKEYRRVCCLEDRVVHRSPSRCGCWAVR